MRHPLYILQVGDEQRFTKVQGLYLLIGRHEEDGV